MSDNDNILFEKSVDEATLKIIQLLEKQVNKACVVIEAEVKKECPVDQGILRASIQHDVSLSAVEITGTVGSIQQIAPYVHQGTGLYAKDGNGRKTPWKYKAIAGKYKGWHFTHGQKPNPFMERGRNSAKSRVEKILGGKE